MQKYDLTLDVTKIQKERLVKNSYTKRDGTPVEETNLRATVILNKDNILKEDDQKIWKEVGFIVEAGKQDENTNILGKVTQTIWKNENSVNIPVEEEDINVENIPF